MAAPWRQAAQDVLLTVRVQPKASRNGWRFEDDGSLRIALIAPPVDGQANAELLAYLAKLLRTGKGALNIENGDKSRNKTVRIAARSVDSVQAIFRQQT